MIFIYSIICRNTTNLKLYKCNKLNIEYKGIADRYSLSSINVNYIHIFFLV